MIILLTGTAAHSTTETFLDRDVEAVEHETNGRVTRVAVDAFMPGMLASAMQPFTPRTEKAASAIVARYGISERDTVWAYWANYVLSVGAAIKALTGCTLQVSAHANDVFVRTRLGAVPSSLVDKYLFCCAQTMSYAVQRFHLPVDKVHPRPHSLPAMPRWSPPALSELVVVNVARHVPKKNLGDVFSLVNDMARHANIPVRFIQIGVAPGSRLWRSCRTVTPESIERAAHAGVVSAMQRSHLLVYGSRIARNGDRDGVPNVLREAAALGLPTVYERGWANNEVGFSGPSLMVGSLRERRGEIMRWFRGVYPAAFTER